ncbi:Carbonate dehydratase [Dehalogenimonas lykanthroporepellens BL-DC-9]|jgi:carbonic anhydrase|nr:Carbonate dehydratase [Dehalogenimonas lykanthroporepellens BL-DC-9]
MTVIERLKDGFRQFRTEYFGGTRPRFEALKKGQKPAVMIIACSDSRVDPAILTNARLGELFTVRNIANLVPPCEDDGGHHGVSAALEFAVTSLKVEHIIVLGHTGCGGIRALMAGRASGGDKFISNWMAVAEPAREKAIEASPGGDDTARCRAAERAAVVLSLDNLRTFPFVSRRLAAGKLSLHGWYFDLENGELLEYRPETGDFVSVS